MANAKNVLNLRQKIEVLEKLKEVCTTVDIGGTDFSSYDKGVNDKTVASTFDFHCTMTNVGKIRREMIGDTAPALPKMGKLTLRGRMDDAESRIEDLQRQITALHTLVGVLQTGSNKPVELPPFSLPASSVKTSRSNQDGTDKPPSASLF